MHMPTCCCLSFCWGVDIISAWWCVFQWQRGRASPVFCVPASLQNSSCSQWPHAPPWRLLEKSKLINKCHGTKYIIKRNHNAVQYTVFTGKIQACATFFLTWKIWRWVKRSSEALMCGWVCTYMHVHKWKFVQNGHTAGCCDMQVSILECGVKAREFESCQSCRSFHCWMASALKWECCGPGRVAGITQLSFIHLMDASLTVLFCQQNTTCATVPRLC